MARLDDLTDRGPRGIAGAIARQIRQGELLPGDRLPTVREVAAQLGVSPATVSEAWQALRRAGLVESRRGAGAGWSLTRDLASITLLDVYDAIEPGPLFALHRARPDDGCVVGHGIQPALHDVYAGIECTVRTELGKTTLEDVLKAVLAVPR